MESVITRFLRYVKVSTASDDTSESVPSSARQVELSRLLGKEMEVLGLVKVHLDSAGNILGTLPATEGVRAPVLALVAHVDTSPDASGENVQPRTVRYEGGELALGHGISLTEALCPGLEKHVGQELIVTDGSTLLGADDKAGVAEIMAAVESLIENGTPHGELRIVFTTDEEVGNGTAGLDVAELACDFGYTVDGGAIGEIEYENFNAASGDVSFRGVGVHPGSAKDVMVNAAVLAMEFAALLPASEVPEHTAGYEGFFHLHGMEGCTTEAKLHYIIRDHDREKFEARKALFLHCAEFINARHGGDVCSAVVKDTYYNMREKILPHMELIRHAEAAFAGRGVKSECVPIRGGTDGAVLSWMGLPCPNLSTGGYNFHGVREWIPVKSLETMSEVLIDLVTGFAEK